MSLRHHDHLSRRLDFLRSTRERPGHHLLLSPSPSARRRADHRPRYPARCRQPAAHPRACPRRRSGTPAPARPARRHSPPGRTRPATPWNSTAFCEGRKFRQRLPVLLTWWWTSKGQICVGAIVDSSAAREEHGDERPGVVEAEGPAGDHPGLAVEPLDPWWAKRWTWKRSKMIRACGDASMTALMYEPSMSMVTASS